MTTPTGNPFLDLPPDTTYVDTIEAWTDAKRVEWLDDGKAMHEVGDRLAAELERARAMVVALEQENHALRELVEWAREVIHADQLDLRVDPSQWIADADQVLAGDE